MQMDTGQLLAFERIVRERSFSRAARALDIAQPTISERIHTLERAVGGSLLVRGGRGVELTDLGAAFLPYARRALELLDSGVEFARLTQSGGRGRATVGLLESLSGSFLGPALAAFHATHPDVDVLVRAGRQRQVIDLLYDGVVSLAIVAWPCPEGLSGELQVLMHMREPAVLVCAPSHPLARLPEVTTEAVASLAHPLLVMQWWLELPREVAHLAELARPAVDVPMDTGRYMVLRGTGAGIFPWLQVAEAIAAGHMVQLPIADQQLPVRDSALVRRVGSPTLGSAAQGLVGELVHRAEQVDVLINPTVLRSGVQ
jgi:DNA-binding transcriptional LysR family regulator